MPYAEFTGTLDAPKGGYVPFSGELDQVESRAPPQPLGDPVGTGASEMQAQPTTADAAPKTDVAETVLRNAASLAKIPLTATVGLAHTFTKTSAFLAKLVGANDAASTADANAKNLSAENLGSFVDDPTLVDRVSHAMGNALGMIAESVFTAGEAPVAKVAQTVTETLGGIGSQAFRAAIVPGLTSASEKMQEVYDKTGDKTAAFKAGLASYAGTTAMFTAPVGLTGGVATRAATGAAIQPMAGEAAKSIENLGLPGDMRQPIDIPGAYTPEAMAAGAVFGVGMGHKAPLIARATPADILKASTVDEAIATAQKAVDTRGNLDDALTSIRPLAPKVEVPAEEPAAGGVTREVPSDAAITPLADREALLQRSDPLSAIIEGRNQRSFAADAAARDQAAQKQAELDVIQNDAASLNLTQDGRGERARAVEAAADVQAPTAMKLALDRAIDKAIGPEPDGANVEAAPAKPREPRATWFGRRGDGYVTEADAAMALPSRQRNAPDLSWKIEAMPSGRFRLAGYEVEVGKFGDGTRPKEIDTGVGQGVPSQDARPATAVVPFRAITEPGSPGVAGGERADVRDQPSGAGAGLPTAVAHETARPETPPSEATTSVAADRARDASARETIDSSVARSVEQVAPDAAIARNDSAQATVAVQHEGLGTAVEPGAPADSEAARSALERVASNGRVGDGHRSEQRSESTAAPEAVTQTPEVSRYIGKYSKGMGHDAARLEAGRLNREAAKAGSGITYTAEEHGNAKLENPWAVVGRKAAEPVAPEAPTKPAELPAAAAKTEAEATAAPEPAKAGKPRLAESADSLWTNIRGMQGGVVHDGRIIVPTLQVIGGEQFKIGPSGALEVVDRKNGGMGVRDATNAEADEFHRDLTADRVQVQLMSPPGYGSGYKAQRVLRVLHSPSGNDFRGKTEAAKPAEPIPDATRAETILDAAGIKGTERISALKDVKSGAITVEELARAHPAPEAGKPVAQELPKYKDPAAAQELVNSITEGEGILESGQNSLGKKLSLEQLGAVRRSIESTKAKLDALPTEAAAETQGQHPYEDDGTANMHSGLNPEASIKAGIKLATDIIRGEYTGPGAKALEGAREVISGLVRDAFMHTAPLSLGTKESRAAGQKFANDMRAARHQWQRMSEDVKMRYSKEQREEMWNAADEQNTLMQEGKDTTGKGLDRLTPKQRATMQTLHEYSNELWKRAQDVGLVTGDGLPFWTPRAAVMIGEDGSFSRVGGEGKKTTSSGVGRNVMTSAPSALHRKHLTTEDSEAALKAKKGDNAAYVRDVLTMPLAMSRFEQAIAGRELINTIKEVGLATGKETVNSTGGPDFFTLDHPAFTTYKYKTEDGNTVAERTPLFISKDFEGPLKAVMSAKDGDIYSAYMLMKGKAMTAIMASPLTHNMVIYGRALAYSPLKVGSGYLYWKGHALSKDNALMDKFIRAGMVPIGANKNSMMDITDVARGIGRQGSWGDPNESWVSLSAQKLGNALHTGWGDGAKAGLDAAGDFLHHTLLWKQVGAVQVGIANDARQFYMSKGLSDEAATTLAAHLSNRYAGAVAQENMSEMARKVANVVLFSRSFNIGNLGTIKDMFSGMPEGLKAKLLQDVGEVEGQRAIGMARRKAITTVATDVAIAIGVNSVVQSAVNYMRQESSEDKITRSYLDRLGSMFSHVMSDHVDYAKDAGANLIKHPTTVGSYNPYRLSSTHDNEPGKHDRIDMGEQPGGRHEYMRLPTGKVVEDLIGWVFAGGDTFDKKLSPAARSLLQLKTNDRGFGVPVLNPENEFKAGDTPTELIAKMGKKLYEVAAHLVESQVPWDTLKNVYDLTQGKATDLDKSKLAGFATGFTFSQGHPQGPEGAVAAQVEDRVQGSRKYLMEQVKRDLKYGEEDAARAKLEAIGLVPREINLIIRRVEDPKSGLSKSARQKFNKHANDDERDLMDSQR